ncbi:MAG: DUF4339 domain-containing protein [Verrucomicrobiota bacterium]
MSDQWHLLNNGQQYGPYSEDDLVQFVQEGRIVRESLLWTEGMDGWVAAATLEGLFPPVAVAVALPRAVPRPVAASSAAAARSPQRATTAGRAPTQGGHGTKQGARVVPVGPYPAQAIKPATFELLLTLFGSGLALLGIAAWAQWTMRQSEVAAQANQILMLRVMLVAAVGCLVAFAVLNYIYLARIWSALQYGRPRTTPGKAVGLLFVPFFNLYWLFVAFYGLAQDWNRITTRFGDLNRAPKLSEGLFLAYCCCSIVVFPVAIILWFPVMLQICRAISFMALPPQHRARYSAPR